MDGHHHSLFGAAVSGDQDLLDPAWSDPSPDLLCHPSAEFMLNRVYGERLATYTGLLILPRWGKQGVALVASFDIRIVHWFLHRVL